MFCKITRNKIRENTSFLEALKGNTPHPLLSQYMSSLGVRRACPWSRFPVSWRPSGNYHPHQRTTMCTLTWVWPYLEPLTTVSEGRAFRPTRQAVLVSPLKTEQKPVSIKISLTKHNPASNKIYTHVSVIYLSQTAKPFHTPWIIKSLLCINN